MKEPPLSLVHRVYVSGIPIPGLLYSDSDVASVAPMRSIEVYRHSRNDPVTVNCDRYPMTTLASHASVRMVRARSETRITSSSRSRSAFVAPRSRGFDQVGPMVLKVPDTLEGAIPETAFFDIVEGTCPNRRDPCGSME